MIDSSTLRIAMLFPTVELGAYWQPVLSELSKVSQKTILFTGRPWVGFDPEAPDASLVKVAGKTRRITTSQEKTDYSGGYMYLSPGIVGHLLQLRPQVIFASAFSAWTLMALLLKPLCGWRVVIAWDGSSPNVDFRHSKLRLLLRRAMALLTDAFMTNTLAGKAYLIECLGVKEASILAQPYMVPDVTTLLRNSKDVEFSFPELQRPVFLYVGRIEQRKGLHQLLEACTILQKQGCFDYTLLIVGNGPKRQELEEFCQEQNLAECVKWVGWVDYNRLGSYFRDTDIFVFPTLEDVWGMVGLEAMAFGKPILCSKWAGASEIVVEGKNGYIVDPHDPAMLAEKMRCLIEKPDLIGLIGQSSSRLIAKHTPKAAAQLFIDVAYSVLKH